MESTVSEADVVCSCLARTGTCITYLSFVIDSFTRLLYAPSLSKSLSKTLMADQRFALFALGDRAYGPQFCAAGRKFAARLVQLGAAPVAAVGYGDDGTPNGGVFADLDMWIDNTLLPVLPKREEVIDSTSCCESEYNVIVLNAPQKEQPAGLTNKEWMNPLYHDAYQKFFARSCPLMAYTYSSALGEDGKVPLTGHFVSNKRITAESWEQNTRHISIDVTGKREGVTDSLPYQAGDVATVFPANSYEDVERLIKVLPESIQSMLDSHVSIEMKGNANRSGSISWPHRCTLRGLLTYCADVQAFPEREDLRVLSRFCDLKHPMGKDQHDKLLSLSDTDGAALYADYILREKRCWADVLYDFDSIQLTVESLLSLLPTMRPRHFSIASAPSVKIDGLSHDKFRVELCVAVVEGTTPLGRSYHGLCSNYLAKLTDDATVLMWIQPGSFGKLPLDLNEKGRFETPILCIGSGTGIAPLRSLLLEREAVFEKESKTNPNVDDDACDNLLVFGCRKKSVDYYYQNEWDALVRNKRLRVWTAFSRDQWHKIYVQQVLRGADEGKLVEKHILENQGAIYVAGGAKMARAVKEEILECLAKAVGNEKQAVLLLKRMHLQGRYNVEAWS